MDTIRILGVKEMKERIRTVKVQRVAKSNGVPKAYTVKVNGVKYPRGYREWYFVSDKESAKLLAELDYFLDSF